jgi:hypothetical protein
MATFEQEWEERFKKLSERHERGEISYDELVKQGNAGLRKMEKQWGHKRTTTDHLTNGATIEWCDSCGAKVSSTSSGQLAAANTSGGGCVVVGIALVGGLIPAVAVAVETLTRMMGQT